MSFSERFGYYSKAIQIDSLDQKTRNLLWNALNTWIFDYVQMYIDEARYAYDRYNRGKDFFSNIWGDFLKIKRTSLSQTYAEQVRNQCEHYLDNCLWYEYYEFIEYVISEFKYFKDEDNYSDHKEYFTAEVNKILVNEKCQFRLVNDLFVPITNEGEVKSIENAINDTNNIITVNSHLRQALKLFSDRKEPDYRNSIKESISALESLFKIISGNNKDTLSDAIKTLRVNNKMQIHTSLFNSINSLYGWAGDEDGVRHAQKKVSNIDIEDAQLVLIICCSFISYFTAKSIKAGIQLQ